MKLKDLLKRENLLILEQSPSSIEDALTATCSRLVELGIVTEEYPKAIIKNHHELGAYYVIAPKIALPHARPEHGVIDGGLQLTLFKEGMDFGNEDNGEAYLAITFSAKDSERHNATIRSLMEFLSSDEDVEAVIASSTEDEILAILAKY